jgi:hypothetical protein
MTEYALGQADAEPRWAGAQRHQVVLALVAVTLLATWVLVSAAPSDMALGALGAVALITPVGNERTVGILIVTALQYGARSRWSQVRWHLRADDGIDITRRRVKLVHAYSLAHVGRLDLSTRDVEIHAGVTELLERLAATTVGGQCAVYVEVAAEGATTTLISPRPVSLTGWQSTTDIPFRRGDEEVRLLREHWSHLTMTDGFASIARVQNFAPGSERAQLAQLQMTGVSCTLALTMAVVARSRALRYVSRAVHRVDSDATAVSALGFRRSARTMLTLAHVQEREARVASGEVLVQLALYVVVWGPTREELRRAVQVVRATSRDQGMVLHWGRGRQATWFGYAQPGGGEW